MAVRVPTPPSAVAPPAEPSAAVSAPEPPPRVTRDPDVIATRDERRARTGVNAAADGQPKAAPGTERSASLERALDAAQAAEKRGTPSARSAAAAEPKRAPESADPAAARAAATDDGPPTPVVASVQGAPDARRPDGESSIITSAPALGAEPPRGPSPARPGTPKTAPASAVDPAAKTRPMPSLSGESGLLAGSRAKRDRTKSPGFYSNLAPAHAADKVSAGLSQSTLKRTMLGVAPPADVVDGTAPLARSTASQRGAVAEPAAEAAAPSAAGSTSQARGVPPATAAADTASPATERRASAARLASAAPAAESDSEEKEDTSPGLGHTRSRHDPVLRLELPEGDLDLLVDFVMDLSLGLARDAWLAPAREAVARLRAAAVRVQKNGLEKALGQLSVELDAPNVLSEERRARIQQALVLVDLALPRPMDVPGQRLVRERLIVQHLVTELATSHPRVARWLRDENIASLDRVGRLTTEELVEKAEVSHEQAAQVLSELSGYLEERARRGPQLSLLGKTRALEQRLAELESSAEHFESVADSDDRNAKREARRRRQSDIARLNLFLAERGEAVLLGELERCSVQGKIARLRRWLTEQPASSVRNAGAELPKLETTG